MRVLAVFFEPTFWILRILFALAAFFLLTSPSYFESEFFLVLPFLWLVGGFLLIGIKPGKGSKKIFAAVFIDMIPPLILTATYRSPETAGSYLIPFLDAALGDGSLFNVVVGVGVLELLIPGYLKGISIFNTLLFYLPFVPLLFSLLFSVYVFRFYKQSQQSETLISLIEVGQSLGTTLNLETVFEKLENTLNSLYHYNAFVLYLVDEQDKIAQVKINRSPFPNVFTDFSLTQDNLLTEVLKNGHGKIIRDLKIKRDPLIPAIRTFRSAALIPLQLHGEPLGLFMLIHPYPAYFEEEDLRVLSILSNQAAIALKNVRLHEKTSSLAVTDSLTGLYTHGYFQTMLQDRLAEQARVGKPASLLMIDLDWFKKVNDTFGHPQGDRVLAQLGKIVKNILTSKDILARYGGDEFVAFVSDSNKMSAVALAERIRSTIQDVPFMVPGSDKSIRLSVSIGVAGFPEDGSGSLLIDAADKALYQAKQTGRNKIAYAGQDVRGA